MEINTPSIIWKGIEKKNSLHFSTFFPITTHYKKKLNFIPTKSICKVLNTYVIEQLWWITYGTESACKIGIDNFIYEKILYVMLHTG